MARTGQFPGDAGFWGRDRQVAGKEGDRIDFLTCRASRTAELAEAQERLGHIGYGVVPWKRRRGYATQALKALLPEPKALGMRFVEITTDLDNEPSQRVIVAAGGYLLEQFTKTDQYGGKQGLRYRIDL